MEVSGSLAARYLAKARIDIIFDLSHGSKALLLLHIRLYKELRSGTHLPEVGGTRTVDPGV